MKFGFALRRLALTGPGKPAAEVAFTRGLNVVAGPSDTGKSFIVQCIDYAFGSGDTPKDIPEAGGYTTVVLEIESNQDQRFFTLERSIRGGDILLKTQGQAERVLAAKHQGGKDDTVSQFLLGLSGLNERMIRTNQQGATRPLSFRKIAPLILVDEETVIKETSPVLSGQHTDRTLESGVFRLLLTGTDDSSVIAKEDPKIARGRQQGKAEALAGLLQTAREELAELGEVGSLIDERDRLARLDAALQVATVARDGEQASAFPIEAKRRAAWAQVRAIASKLNVQLELQRRFELLQEQYGSDLRRLEAISEAGSRLDQLKEERCPVCGAQTEHHDDAHRLGRPAPADVRRACQAEAAKTIKLLQGLKATRAATAADVERLQTEREARQGELDAVATDLKTLIEQRVNVLTKKVDDVRARRDACKKALEGLERVHGLEGLLAEANTSQKRERAEGPASTVSTGQAEAFSREVEALLRAWHFPNLDRVTFSERDQDLVISGRARKSHGKGVRAITRTAFNLGLLRLCAREGRPFPNLMLIDSPLLVYEKPDAGETEFPQDIKKHFWESVKASFADAQVIVIENSKQLPDADSIGDVNVVLFTGNDQGRRGFIP